MATAPASAMPCVQLPPAGGGNGRLQLTVILCPQPPPLLQSGATPSEPEGGAGGDPQRGQNDTGPDTHQKDQVDAFALQRGLRSKASGRGTERRLASRPASPRVRLGLRDAARATGEEGSRRAATTGYIYKRHSHTTLVRKWKKKLSNECDQPIILNCMAVGMEH
ncbi:Protein of unknown function [Gryllus bimaculatus]|nr:Protein of unknown function [Gryllus bimaculatus]